MSGRVLGLATILTLAAVCLVGCTSHSDTSKPRPSSQAEGNERMVQCLSDRGWDAVLSSDGGIESSFPSEQEEVYSADVDDCFDVTGVNQVRTLNTDEFKKGYDLMSSSLECLRATGLDLPDAPSYQAFVDSNAGYTPYRDLPDELYDELIEACPQPQLW
ncbi:hypothetical protein E3T55_10960 [Cryobacterium frigoriphilum]|uniref:Uncharacterized protein n=1 Tax=Cryobacterium frigoriphilum TaxID=1259150 RepID=A0A4R8ZZU7_9MICO|nr:hypothetical protein [Cryobacterium frigoriphilum]TFD49591.1 hypothetical protein E3T55_10960 [Cryobacterium frigoriphilum]